MWVFPVLSLVYTADPFGNLFGTFTEQHLYRFYGAMLFRFFPTFPPRTSVQSHHAERQNRSSAASPDLALRSERSGRRTEDGSYRGLSLSPLSSFKLFLHL